MFLVPEPRLILFQSKKFSCNMINDKDKLRYDSFVQLPRNEFKNSWDLTFHSKLSQKNKEKKKNFFNLYFGMNALRLGLIETAEYFFKKAAFRGSVEAMNLLGNLYIYQPNRFMYNKEDATIWLKRALVYKNINCLMKLADLYNFYYIHDKALLYGFYYYKYFKDARIIKIICENMNDKCLQLRSKLECYCLANGLALHTNDNENFQKQEQNYIPMNYNCNVLKVHDLYNSLEIKYDYQQIKYEKSVKKHNIINDNNNNNFSKIDECQMYTHDCSCKPLIVSNNGSKSLTLLKIFKLASVKYEERNLFLCKCYINKLFENNPKYILETNIFKNKSLNGTDKDLFSCGLIAFLVNEIDISIDLLKKASEKGNSTADSFLGLFLFHDEKTRKQSLYYFLKCSTDFISLSYLYLSTKEYVYLSRLKYIFGEEEEEYKIFESIGDIFWNGIKLPENKFIAKIFYGISLSKNKDYNSIANLTTKLNTPI